MQKSKSYKEWENALAQGVLDSTLSECLCINENSEDMKSARERVLEAIAEFSKQYDSQKAREIALFSAPGRTELLGNHTDHQQGKVLAGSVNLDAISVAATNDLGQIRLLSKGWSEVTVDLSNLNINEDEYNTTRSLIRGVAARVLELAKERGVKTDVKGIDLYVESLVFPGSGLSSSAAVEVLFACIFSHFWLENPKTLNSVDWAKIGQYAENVYFGKPSGLMDQMACAVGGIVGIDFENKQEPVITPVPIDLVKKGYALCIIESGASHEDLTDAYAEIPLELKKVCEIFDKKVLREVDEEEFMKSISTVRAKVGDRAVLRAMHIFEENRRVSAALEAVQNDDFNAFLEKVKQSGRSSWMYLQNICPTGYVEHQEMAVALAVTEYYLDGKGAFRVHGGGFAGTIQAFVPLDILDNFKTKIENVLGEGKCHILSIRPVGTISFPI